MSIPTDSDDVYGSHALPASLARLRAMANARGAGLFDRRLASITRKLLYLLTSPPYDVPVFRSQKLRLYPKSNRCEKRAFVGISSWDQEERTAIAADLAASVARDDSFVFLDCGANIGLYSLFARDEALALGKPFVGLAIEPDPVNQKRLAFNLDASDARDVTIAPFAIGREEGVVRFVSSVSNRGEAHVASETETDHCIELPMRPLLDLVKAHGIDHIDVMKIDIEGHEFEALEPFFDAAPKSLWPKKILIEVGRDQKTDALSLCLDRGYRVEKAININAYLALETPDQTVDWP